MTNSEPKINEEAVLIERIKQGERCSFDSLVTLYQQKGLAIAYNLVGNLEDARDVLQEAFIKAYLNISHFREESRFYTWFYRILVNCSLDFLRRRQKTTRLFVEPIIEEEGKEQKDMPDLRYVPTNILITNELNRNLDNCIADLPERQRICFIMKHQNGLANSEIAEVLRCRVSTVKVHLFRAVKALQDKLSVYLAK